MNAFWSVTVYDHQSLLVDNPLHRFAIGNRASLDPNPDGSLTILVQPQSSGARQSLKLAASAGWRSHSDHAPLLANNGNLQPSLKTAPRSIVWLQKL